MNGESGAATTSWRRAKPGLGTIVDIWVQADDAALAQRALAEAFDEISTVHRLMSFHDRDSDLTRWNAAAPGTWVDVDARTADVLAFAQALARDSDGAFDAAVADPLIASGVLPAEPVPSGRWPARPQSNDGSERRRVVRTPARMDLGGIAKGYAVDRALAILMRRGVTSALVNAGGDLRHAGRTAVPVHLRDPLDPGRSVGAVLLDNQALASSATHGWCSPGRMESERPVALIDPRRSRPLTRRAGVSVAAPSCLWADALTKVVLVSGRAHHPLLRSHGAQVLQYRVADDVAPAGIG